MARSTDSHRPEGGKAKAKAGGDVPAWGAHRPGLPFRIVLGLSRAVPQLPLVKQVAFLLRRAGRTLCPGVVDVRHWGLRLRLRTQGNLSEATFLFMPHRWDRPERRFLAQHLRPGATFVDVGANAGGYLWWIQRLLGSDWTGVAVEPDPDLRARLRLNLAGNGMDHVRVVAAAVGAAEGTARFRIDPDNRGQNVLVPDHAGSSPIRDGRELQVPVLRLPELLEAAGLERVDALKIDVEGLETGVLGDLLDRVPAPLLPRLVLTELRESPEHRTLLDRLRDRGYRLELRTRLNAGLVR